MSKLKIFIDRDRMWGDTFAVRIGTKPNESVKWCIAERLVFREVTDDEIETSPVFTLTKDEAQAFIDELWHAGLRPTEGTGSAGAMAAVQAHLKDMQRLVFDGRVPMKIIPPPDQR